MKTILQLEKELLKNAVKADPNNKEAQTLLNKYEFTPNIRKVLYTNFAGRFTAECDYQMYSSANKDELQSMIEKAIGEAIVLVSFAKGGIL